MLPMPYRLPVHVGETIDSWLVAYCHLAQTSIADMFRAAGQSTDGLNIRPVRLALQPVEPFAEVFSAAEAIDHASLLALQTPFHRYLTTVSASRQERRVDGGTGLDRLLLGSRFCPACLRDNGGRWLSTWRIPWVLTCPTHATLLAQRCPECGRRTRERPIRRGMPPAPPHCCQEPRAGATGRARAMCSADLRDHEQIPAPPHLLALAARAHHILSGAPGTMRPGHPDADFLADLRLISCARLTKAGLAAIASGTGDVEVNAEALEDVADIVLNPGGAAFRALVAPEGESRTVPFAWRRLSRPLLLHAVAARERTSTTSERLRWRATSTPRIPDSDVERARARVRYLPADLWPEWTLRLRPQGLTASRFFPAVAALALLLPGSIASTGDLVALSPIGAPAAASRRRLFLELAHHERGHDVIAALTLLADALGDLTPSPIDYQRRRTLAEQHELLHDDDFTHLARRTGFATGAVRSGWCRAWLWETITGGSYVQSDYAGTRRLRGYYSRFLRTMSAELVVELRAHARAWLDSHGLTREPLDWAPPVPASLNGSRWPGLEPGQPWPSSLKTAVHGRAPLSAVAADHGLELDQVRLLLRTGLLGFADSPTTRVKSLDPGLMRELLEVEELDVEDVAARLDVCSTTVLKYARASGIETRSRGTNWVVDLEWLARQHHDLGRPMFDLATTLGISSDALTGLVRATNDGLEATSPTGAVEPGDREAKPLMKGADLPPLLKRCLHGHYGWLRVRRFQTVAGSASFSAAAATLRCSPGTLSSQMGLLERAAGGDLVVRRSRAQQALSLTPLGRRLAQEAARHLDVVAPQPPQPLATALATHRALPRLRRMLTVVEEPSLGQGAERLGTAVTTLIKSLRTFEDACDLKLFAVLERHEPVQLTAEGACLAKQARAWSVGTTPYAQTTPPADPEPGSRPPPPTGPEHRDPGT